ncbi:MAG: PD40 domain-containing protein [Acidobacteria bacterium]|nr:PD40 domain-containing protein [Acidobacteriota bacterium]
MSSWSPDGKTIAYTHYDPTTAGDIWTITIGEKQPKAFLKTPFNEHSGAFSPDGRWIAYTSNESGRDEIFVVPHPAPGGRWQVSTDGGAEPVWSRDGQELFYRNGDKMMAVTVETRPTFAASTPKQLFEAPFVKDHRNDVNYDVSPDGKRFLMIKEFESQSSTAEINIVLNWFSELQPAHLDVEIIRSFVLSAGFQFRRDTKKTRGTRNGRS